jgi:hypothetical protein
LSERSKRRKNASSSVTIIAARRRCRQIVGKRFPAIVLANYRTRIKRCAA